MIEDDDGDARLVIDDLTERLRGAKVVRCRTLREALSEPRPVDCIVLDLGLPDARGLDAVNRVRELMATTPLVVLTGLDDEAAGAAAVDAGAQDYLVKGRLRDGDLARAIHYAIGRWQIANAEW